MTIAIIGGGLAGGTAATELRTQGFDGEIVLFAAEPHAPYERPPLSKGYLLGKDPLDKAFVHPDDWYGAHDVDVRVETPVMEIDLVGHTVHTAHASLAYDGLLVATGATPRRFAPAEAAGPPVHYLRTIEDSTRLREAFTTQPRVVMVGAGWVGLEVAAAAREAGCEVVVHDVEQLPLVRVLGPEVAQVFADLHRAHGVDLRMGAAASPDDLAAADLIVVGIGAEPSVALAADAGLAIDNGILVDASLRASHAHVYAVGDVANHDHPTLGRLRVEHWDNAIEQAKVAAHNLLGAHEAYDRQPYFFTDQYDLGMEYVGHTGAQGYDDVIIEGDLGGAFRAFWTRDGVVVAASQVNDWDASDEIKASIGTRRAR